MQVGAPPPKEQTASLERHANTLQKPDDGLIKAVRSLDSAESIPETLSNLWALLANSISGPFHASEELVLRWLLKNMSGTADTAERFRRYPMAWSVMACVFRRIPLISLAKSLADRRFIPILQQALKDVSTPQSGASNPTDASSPDVEMVDAGSASPGRISRKRKRTSHAEVDLENLRTTRGCLVAAEALLGALGTLLERLEMSGADAPSSAQMGAEHIKSLFCSHAKEAADLLRPILSICDLTLQEQEQEPFENQSSWIALFASLWSLHLQNRSDANEVAVSLYPTGAILLAKMDRSKDVSLDLCIKAAWTQDLRRFFIKNMILPARAAFVNGNNVDIIRTAVDVTNYMPTASCPVLFSLAVRTPYSTEDASTRKDHEVWTQNVFEVIEQPIRKAEPLKRNQATKVVLDTALRNRASISLTSLRTVCRQHIATSGQMDLDLVALVANVDVDAFLTSDDGHSLLDDILKQVTGLKNAQLETGADSTLLDFIILLAKGFARSRDFSGFIKKWYEALSHCSQAGAEYSAITDIWSSDDVIGAVSSLLQSSINVKQLLAVLDWLESREAESESEAFLVILDAISHGIAEEAFVDDVNFRLYQMVSKLRMKSLHDSAKARWWRVVELVVSRAALEQSGIIWTSVEPDLKKVLKKGELGEMAIPAAFRCCSRFWLANYPGGPHEAAAAAMTHSFLKRLKKHGQEDISKTGYGGLELYDIPRLVDLLTKSKSRNDYLEALVSRADAMRATEVAVTPVIHNEVNLNNYNCVTSLVDNAIALLAQVKQRELAWNTERIVAAAQILLDSPFEAVSREQREQIMANAIFVVLNLQSQESTQRFDLVKILLSLMVKITKRPTFYPGMKFADLLAIGDVIIVNFQGNCEGETDFGTSLYGTLKLFEAFATSTLKHMTCNLDKRDLAYLTEASSAISNWAHHSTELQPQRYIIARSLVLALDSLKAQCRVQEVASPNIVREHISLMAASWLSADWLQRSSRDTIWSKGGLTAYCNLVILEQLDVVEPAIIRKCLSASMADLEQFCEMLCSHGAKAGWRLRELTFCCYGDGIKGPLSISADHILRRPDVDDSVPLSLRFDIGDVNRYIDVVLRNMSEDARSRYFGDIGGMLRDDYDITGHLLAIHRLTRAETGTYSR